MHLFQWIEFSLLWADAFYYIYRLSDLFGDSTILSTGWIVERSIMISKTDSSYVPKNQSLIKGQYDNGVGITSEMFRDTINGMYEKIVSGDVEESYQTGGESFTRTEWEKLLAQFDDAQEVVRKLMRERHEKLQEKRLKDERLEEERLDDEQLKEYILKENVLEEINS